MSDSSSQEAPSQFTKSSISAHMNKKPSILTFESGTSSSNDKDALLDEYQAKMGDMLKCQQDLCSVKSQLSEAIDQMRQLSAEFKKKEQDYQSQIASLNQKIQSLETSNDSQMRENGEIADKAAKWKAKCKEYQDIIDKQQAELKEKDEVIAAQEQSIKDLKDKHDEEIGKLVEKLKNTKANLKSLSKQHEELSQQNSSASECYSQQQKQIEVMTDENRKLEKSLRELKKEKSELKSQLKHSSEESALHSMTITEQQKSIQTLREQKDKYKEKCKELVHLEQRFKEQSERILAMEADANEMKSKCHELEKKCASEAKKTKVATHLFSKIGRVVGDPATPKDIVQAVKSLAQENARLMKQCNENTHQITDLEKVGEDNAELRAQLQKSNDRCNTLNTKLKISKAIEEARRDACRQVTSLGVKFGFGSEEIPFRSVIITVVLAHRISKFVHGMGQPVDDSRNWWWLSTGKDGKLQNHMASLSSLLADVQSENGNLVKQLGESNKKSAQLECEVVARDSQLEEHENSIKFLHAEIRKLNDELSSLIDPQTYESLRVEFIQKKKSLKVVSQQVKELTREKLLLEDKLEEANIACQDQSNEIAVLQEELEVAQSKVQALSEEVQLLQKAQLAKTKELLSLERGFHKEKVTNDRNTAQCQALALENQQLFNQLHPSKVMRNMDPEGGIRLGLRSTKTLL